jgi:hypothetical protein
MASSSHLKQGEKGAITVRVSTAMKSGPIEEKIEVVSNDPERPKVILILDAVVLDNLLPAVKSNSSLP